MYALIDRLKVDTELQTEKINKMADTRSIKLLRIRK